MTAAVDTSLAGKTLSCQNALRTLQQLGCSSDADGPLGEAADDIAAVTGVWAADETRTDAYILVQYAKTYISVLNMLELRLTAAANSASTQYQQDAAEVFGTAGLKGDAATLVIARRDAGERAAGENDSIKLQRLLAQAAIIGDDTLSRAVVEKAVSLQDFSTVQEFQAAYPALADATSRLWNAATKGITSQDLVTGMRLAALKPAPLQRLMDYEIETAAAGSASAGSWNA